MNYTAAMAAAATPFLYLTHVMTAFIYDMLHTREMGDGSRVTGDSVAKCGGNFILMKCSPMHP